MSVDLVCPDCGGIIGGNGAGGQRVCTCFTAARPGGGGSATKESDTVAIESPVKDLNARQQKLCISCGKDTAGHRRIKDSRGYMCYDCAKAEREAEIAGTVPCAECGKRVRPGGLVKYAGILICRACHSDHKEAGKKAVRKVATRHYEEHEKKTLIWLSVAFVVLLCLVIYATIRLRAYTTHSAATTPATVWDVEWGAGANDV